MKHLSQIFIVVLLLLSACTGNKTTQTDTKQIDALLAEVQKTLATDTGNDKAIALLEKGMKDYPESHMIPSVLGFIKLDEGDSASARIFFQKALEVCEKQLAKAPTAYDSVQKACYLMMMDEDEKAKAAFQEIPSFKQAFEDEEYDEIKKEIGNTVESWRNAYRTHKEIFGK